ILSRPEIRELLDYSIFIKTTEEVRFKRRLARDVAERGRTPEGVSRQFEKYVKPMHDLFVEPSQQYADKVFRGEGSMRGPLIETLELFGYSSRVEVPKGV
ncbi:MAG: hypothetical protein KDD59_14310, partial [Bdellovibrionales bacterium]|nr:hypothetical protein [Bdellovibrionales bacterium]